MPSRISPSLLTRLDPQRMFDSIGHLPDQVEAAWSAISTTPFPASYRRVRHVVVAGMGGSAIGTHLIQSVFRDRLSVPITIVSDYTVPSWVNRETLLLLSSYSGGTEEILAVAESAQRAGIPMIALTTGGALSAFARAHRLPAVVFGTEHNPCGQPRIGLGYAVTYQLGVFRQVGLIDLTDQEMRRIIRCLRAANAGYSQLAGPNPALELAHQARLRMPIIVASEHLAGNAHIFANQWNENAKNFAAWFVIPELNHHLLEGLTAPAAVRKRLLVLMIESGLYDPRNRKRYGITTQVLRRQGIACQAVLARGETPLEQAFDLLLLGSYASFYQAVANRVNPTPIPWVDEFKRLMGRAVTSDQ
ncbi:MAG: hypothetical protein HY710_16510 [Candidatus Latescibacteria bacterium]|nr:hypothetical protein [Candidatus Latescibacterota bacterium]